MSLSNMLRASRLAQVYKSSKPLSTGLKIAPTHQVIETKPALLKFHEWGLKSAIPSKVKTQYLMYKELDTLERLTDFEPRGGANWNRIRVQEFGLSPRYNANTKNPLFNKEHYDFSSLNEVFTKFFFEKQQHGSMKYGSLSESRKLFIKNVRQEFKEWLVAKYPEAILNQSFTKPDNMLTYGKEFLQSYNNRSSSKLNSPDTMIGTGGLTYALKGRLRNSPNGVIQKHIVPGRFVAPTNDNKIAAIGGFVANAASSVISAQPQKWVSNRDKIYPFEVSNLSVNNGQITLDAKGTMLNKPEQKRLRRNHYPKPLYGNRYSTGERKSDVAESLKAIRASRHIVRHLGPLNFRRFAGIYTVKQHPILLPLC